MENTLFLTLSQLSSVDGGLTPNTLLYTKEFDQFSQLASFKEVKFDLITNRVLLVDGSKVNFEDIYVQVLVKCA